MSRLVKTHRWYHVSEVEVFSMTANVYSCEPRIHRKLQRTFSMRYYATVLDWTVSATVCALCQHFESLWYNFLCSWSEDLHHIRHCTATSLSDLSNLTFFFSIWNDLIQFDVDIFWGHAMLSMLQCRIQGWGKLDIRPGLPGHKTSEVDRCWSLYRFWPRTFATNATNARWMLQLHTASYSFMCLPMCRICLSLPRTHRKVLAWHAHNVGQIVHTNYTLGLAKCDHCDNMWHALYGSYMHAPIFSAVQLPLSSLRASLSFRDVSQVLLPQQQRQRLLRGIIPCCWSSVVIWCSFSKFIVLPLLCL